MCQVQDGQVYLRLVTKQRDVIQTAFSHEKVEDGRLDTHHLEKIFTKRFIHILAV